MEKIVIFRTDRIGDLVLSAAAAEHIKNRLDARITFAVKEYAAPVLENNPFIDQVLTVDGRSYRETANLIRGNNISISLLADGFGAYSPFFARIPRRFGPFSKLRSILFNGRIRQNRSESIKNEALYNLELINEAFGITGVTFPKIYLTKKEMAWGREYLKNYGIKKDFIILHPGSGGSSLDLPMSKYIVLAENLRAMGRNFIITGTSKELFVYNSSFSSGTKILREELSLRELFALISLSELFISNSTGPLHAAAALNVKTISFYPRLKTCSPLRWGPFSENSERHLIFTPQVSFCNKCSRCKYRPCMDLIDIQTVIDSIK